MNVVILATRIAGTDGVSLEAVRWKEILTRMGHKVTFVAGELDTSGVLIPELHFHWPQVVELHDKVVWGKNDYHKVEAEIFELAGKIEGKLREAFNGGRRIDLLITPNVFSLPMHFPLAVSLARIIEELKIPTIARHHDFWWERKRFLRSSMFPFFSRWFPPELPTICHVVINSLAQEELKKRTGVKASIIWDCFDFSSDIGKGDFYSKHWREDFGIKEDDLVFLQATRVVPRKRIELAIELVGKLKNPKAILVVSGRSGDEGREYERRLRKLVKSKKVRVKFIGRYVNSKRRIIAVSGMGEEPKRRRVYTLWDSLANADFVTYPTMVEGFGNQFVEAVYFRKPIILTPYPVFRRDIAPLGFEVVTMNEAVGPKTTEALRALIDDGKLRDKIVRKNFGIGKKCFSYEWVEGKLKVLFEKMNLT